MYNSEKIRNIIFKFQILNLRGGINSDSTMRSDSSFITRFVSSGSQNNYEIGLTKMPESWDMVND